MSSSDCIYGINTVGLTQEGSSRGWGNFRSDLFFHSNVVVFSFQMGVLEGPAAPCVLWCFGVIRDGDTAISAAASIPFSEKFREHAGRPRRWSIAGGYKRG